MLSALKQVYTNSTNVIICFLAGVLIVVSFLYKYKCNESENLKQTVVSLTNSLTVVKERLEKTYEENKVLKDKNEDLEKVSQDDKEFDWNQDISNSPVVIRLRTN